MLDVEMPSDKGPEMLSGRLIVPAYACHYPPAVEANDLIEVDFDQRSAGDGLYLIEALNDRGVEWRGCRRFQVTPRGLMMDNSGAGEWMALSSLKGFRLRVVGTVRRVYRPTD